MIEASIVRPHRAETGLGPSPARARARGGRPVRTLPRRSGSCPQDWPIPWPEETGILAFSVETSEAPLAIARCDALLVQVRPQVQPQVQPAPRRGAASGAVDDDRESGNVLLQDLRQATSVAPLPGAVHIALHRTLLGEVATCLHAGGTDPLDALTAACGKRLTDATIHALALGASATLHRSDRGATVFRNQLGRALAAHLLGTYAALADAAKPVRGGLAPWQLKRAQDLMRTTLAQSLSLPVVAAACGLSASHFARAFRCSTGTSPHAWLVRQRLARAKDLMRAQDLALADIALSCGFADQSHFTRVFAREEHMSPGRWRRSIEQEPGRP
ncbi:AraC-type DNA-binding protein [Methylobacterium sp. UNC378MF]|uniref:helix-turn-helix domain-containing protein n=1 Tax=Methylobacterium sp. UNC378MF TaxID=1502748 RepID=UPI00088CB270|nr:AraC family transcriptional regulator [Methylobacterium sp. UNC378MF]SDA21082.1 AraC-type DNA-binding protein [Methylobacterium sp. UNC378MF]